MQESGLAKANTRSGVLDRCPPNSSYIRVLSSTVLLAKMSRRSTSTATGSKYRFSVYLWPPLTYSKPSKRNGQKEKTALQFNTGHDFTLFIPDTQRVHRVDTSMTIKAK